jgi:exodeoxyribonuclease VII large subunit
MNSLLEKKIGDDNPIPVSEYISFLNEVLKNIKARVIGEVSEIKIATSGHVYFSLRDKEKESVLRCIIWKSTYRICGIKLVQGMEIIVSGYSDIYSPQGTFNFKAETIELVGEGSLKKAYDLLKEKLSKEGVFDIDKKRKIPDYVNQIGVITSLRSGTVIHDFVSNLGKFGYKIKAIDSRVEGQEAVKDLLDSINFFKKQEIDVLVIIRGGGSLQSLMAFDNEILVKEISKFPVPVIAGIGHHKDITLAALAADVSESTPTATANLLNKSWEKALYKVNEFEKIIIKNYEYFLQKSNIKIDKLLNTIFNVFDLIIKNYKKDKDTIIENIQKCKDSINIKKNKISEIKKGIFINFYFHLKNKKIYLFEIEKTINYNNPINQLKRGYTIVRHNGKILKNVINLKMNELINLELYNGSIVAEIKKIINKKDEQKR